MSINLDKNNGTGWFLPESAEDGMTYHNIPERPVAVFGSAEYNEAASAVIDGEV